MATIRNGIISTEVLTETGTLVPTLQEMKDWLRMTYTTDDTLITGLIRTAITYAESYTGIYILLKTVKVTFTNDGEKDIFLPGPAGASSALTFRSCRLRDWSDVYAQTDEYDFDGNSFIGNWTGYYALTYTAGYADGTVPQGLKDAIKMLVARWYENRGDTQKQQLSIEDMNMLNPFAVRFWV